MNHILIGSRQANACYIIAWYKHGLKLSLATYLRTMVRACVYTYVLCIEMNTQIGTNVCTYVMFFVDLDMDRQ